MKSVDYFPINVERTSWETASKTISDIRYKVFVAEQNVPIEEEIDSHDPTCFHWLAFSDDGTPMATARQLSDGVVGRMAVLKDYRGMGVGASIMRNIIQFSVRENITELTLGAQLHAIPFYERFGFVTEGDIYNDASIDHKTMRLSLHLLRQRFLQQNKSENELRQRLQLEGRDAFAKAVTALADQSRKKIRLFSHQLLPELYNDKMVCEHFYSFVTQNASSHIQVLVRDTDWLSHNTHRLHELGIRLPSHITFRKLDKQANTLHNEFLLADQTGILYQQEARRMVGYTASHAPREARELAEEFDAMWEQGLQDPDLRRLYL